MSAAQARPESADARYERYARASIGRTRPFAYVDLALLVDADEKVPARMPGEQSRRVFVGQSALAG